MLEKPNFQNEVIISYLQSEFSLSVSEFEFLPLGADPNTAVYRAIIENKTSYFVKLRMGNFEETAVTLPRFLSDQGIENIIPPLPTNSGQLWASLEDFKLILYPFVDGRDGFNIDLSEQHWFEFGSALKRIHTAEIPHTIRSQIKCEAYSPKWRELVKAYLESIKSKSFTDPVAMELAAFLKMKHSEIIDLIEQTERLALKLQTDLLPLIVCHSDLHAGNILIDKHDQLYIVDWDNPILAPRERDLMFVGGAQGFSGQSLEDEETLFYRGYGPTDVNQFALAYYRYERIIEDIAVYCEELLSTNAGGEDRERSLHYLKSNFLPEGTINIAYRADKTGLFG